MKILILTDFGYGLGIGQRLVQEGHTVFLWDKSSIYPQIGEGIVTRVTSWRPYIASVDLVICACVGLGGLEEKLRNFGKPILNCSAVADLVVKDSDKLQQFLKIHALDYIPEDPVKVIVEGWYNGRAWLDTFFLSFVDERLMNGGLGPNIGCAGSTSMGIRKGTILEDSIYKISAFMQKIGYRGAISLSCLVDSKGVGVDLVVPGFRYDTIYGMLEGLKEKALDFFFETASGTRTKLSSRIGYVSSLRVSAPPYPYAQYEGRNIEILGVDEKNEKHIFFHHIRKAEEGYRGDGNGLLFSITARGGTVEETRGRIYRTARNIEVQDVQYRTDIGFGVMDKIEQLKAWGYL